VTFAHHLRTVVALGREDFEEAYQQATAISPAGVLAPYAPHALWVLLDVVEAAVRTGRREEAAAHVAAMRAANLGAISPRLALVCTAAAGMAAPDDQHDAALAWFEQAVAAPGAERWSFDLARVRLAYGERLRRGRATAQARVQLDAALAAFQQLGARPWIVRASNELRAIGGTGSRTRVVDPASITRQEREIAMLAAAGLTNKQIGARLFLSHRTVGARLYQVFPKLGVSSRAALRDALAALPADEGRDEGHDEGQDESRGEE
jgi:DNA-binding CsgD family transcriptional regulator